MKNTKLSTITLMLALIAILPFLAGIIDVWAWLIIGHGATGIDWSFVDSSGHVDRVGKPLVAIMFGGGVGGMLFILTGFVYQDERNQERIEAERERKANAAKEEHDITIARRA